MILNRVGMNVIAPSGWDVRLGMTSSDAPGSIAGRLLHASNFALPERRDEFGGGAVERMGPGGIFTALVEYGPYNGGQALFAAHGFPRRLEADWFDPNVLERPLPGQGGVQRFFTEHARAFCLYVVLGSHRDRAMLVPSVNQMLAGISIFPLSPGGMQ